MCEGDSAIPRLCDIKLFFYHSIERGVRLQLFYICLQNECVERLLDDYSHLQPAVRNKITTQPPKTVQVL